MRALLRGEERPPGPFRPEFWRSPLRGPWLTSVFGLVLLVGLPIVAVTGLVSYAAYNPRLPGNDLTPESGLLRFYLFDWPVRPVWIYRVTQGIHVILGLTLVPVLLAKLWSVIPKLFAWPPALSPAQALERASLLLLVGGAVFEFVTGIFNIQLFYIFPFSFYSGHLYGAWIFLAALTVHVAIKLPRLVTALRSRSFRQELRTRLQDTRPEPPDPDGLVAAAPAPPTMSRRGLLTFVGGGSLAVLGLSVGQTMDGLPRRTALLAPHGREYGPGPNDFQVNKTAASVGIVPAETGPGWRLTLAGARQMRLTREELLAMPLHTYRLPIACVEGWSTEQAWTGVRLADLARLCGAKGDIGVYVRSLQKGGVFSHASLSAPQTADPRSLLALRVNGADLSLDHGFPARIIVPGAPGVHNTKWVRELDFRPAS
ncbi:DMSO/TMAO reductase YedYZ molybdopterin-dependent catalytic subunit [Streptosporangium album]|uniref:DMSO/TMAO reductase YedYZ molybdopterin-dependent catalytic subunit n=1 Tax=Streptosporangium album TaxID=47479 RepID=A0A7W7WEP2_9ACTN|nr:molybdopterin-dependent oxidoreductase [Streptosporangium album]MBB4943589.1 DMSO/TMAO reductase YedYZ molybdopterin-dependent catalytic subunit [Streptosporangium album]